MYVWYSYNIQWKFWWGKYCEEINWKLQSICKDFLYKKCLLWFSFIKKYVIQYVNIEELETANNRALENRVINMWLLHVHAVYMCLSCNWFKYVPVYWVFIIYLGVLMMAQEVATGKIFIFNRRTRSRLNVTGTPGSYSVQVTHLPSRMVSAQLCN